MNTALPSPLPWRWSLRSPAAPSRSHPWLEPGGLQRCRLPRAARLRVVAGRAWVTRSGTVEDHFLAPGDVLDVPSGADLLVQADGPQPLRWRWDDPSPRPGATR